MHHEIMKKLHHGFFLLLLPSFECCEKSESNTNINIQPLTTNHHNFRAFLLLPDP